MLYKDLIDLLREDLEAWDFKTDPVYEIDGEMGEALKRLLEQREKRKGYDRKQYQKTRDKRLEYQRQYNEIHRPRKKVASD